MAVSFFWTLLELPLDNFPRLGQTFIVPLARGSQMQELDFDFVD
jgi:hypothetical protein